MYAYENIAGSRDSFDKVRLLNKARLLDKARLKDECAHMTTVAAVVAALAFSFALGSLIQQVDGATLRRWRLSRRWDVSRLAREFIAAADEPLATVHGLSHMINAWERGARKPSERYWLLYLRVFPERANAEAADGSPKESGMPASTVRAASLSSAGGVDQGEIRALAATVSALERQIAGLSRRLEELSRRSWNGSPHLTPPA